MELEFNETEWGIDIMLTPETPEEVAKLARYALNASAKKPNVFLSFSSKPYLSITHQKIKGPKKTNSIHR